jgi:hypothetical protein
MDMDLSDKISTALNGVLDMYSGGGLLIYSKEDIGICRKHELENDIDETIWVEVHAKGHSFLLCNTYRPEWTGFS